MHWAQRRALRKKTPERQEIEPFVVGAVIDPGFCLDLLSANGIKAVERAYMHLQAVSAESGSELPENTGGNDLPIRKLDRAVINSMHVEREDSGDVPFDSVRALFSEGGPLYRNSGFRHKTHIQICVRDPDMIKGVFRVPEKHFSTT